MPKIQGFPLFSVWASMARPGGTDPPYHSFYDSDRLTYVCCRQKNQEIITTAHIGQPTVLTVASAVNDHASESVEQESKRSKK